MQSAKREPVRELGQVRRHSTGKFKSYTIAVERKISAQGKVATERKPLLLQKATGREVRLAEVLQALHQNFLYNLEKPSPFHDAIRPEPPV